MKKLLSFIVRAVVLVALAIWLGDRPGTARIVWHDYVIETSAAFLGLAILAAAFVLYLLFRLWHALWHGPRHWRVRRKLHDLLRGHDQLAKGLAAIAGGNATDAGRFAAGARKWLGITPATRLLQAQAAQLAGDHGAARNIFRALASHSDSAVLGYRGLIMDARRTGDWAELERLIGKLHEIKPNTPWLNLIRFEMLARKREWSDAGAALDRASATQLLDSTQAKQHRAAILVAASQDEARQGQAEKALQSAEQAARQAPDFPPAIINLAKRQMDSGHARATQRTVEKNWARAPHPQLAAVMFSGDADPLKAYRQIEHLCRANEDDPASRLMLAEAALAADLWGEARRHLIGLVSRNQATQAAYRLLARLERRESGDEPAAMQWLIKAACAPPDPVWLCRSCGGAHDEWQPVCKHCGSFNRLEWQSPGVSRGQGSGFRDQDSGIGEFIALS